jgi:hypothetical protein
MITNPVYPSPDVPPGRPPFDALSSSIDVFPVAVVDALRTPGLRGFWRPLCAWLGLALLANGACHWLRRLHPIQAQIVAPNSRAPVKHPG